MTPEALREIAARMAHSLGISLYISDGRIRQIGPGERIEPPKSAHPETHGRFTIAAAAKP